jgi:hypothetical protein
MGRGSVFLRRGPLSPSVDRASRSVAPDHRKPYRQEGSGTRRVWPKTETPTPQGCNPPRVWVRHGVLERPTGIVPNVRLRTDADSDVDLDKRDRAQLEAELDALDARAAGSPSIVHLVGTSGALGIGLGLRRGSVLLFAPHDRSQPPLHSCGDAHAQGSVRLASRGTEYEFSARCVIPSELARKAASSFLQTDRLPSCVAWESEPADTN